MRESIEGLVDAVARVGSCSPAACRDRVARHFSAEAMVKGYERIYRRLVATR